MIHATPPISDPRRGPLCRAARFFARTLSLALLLPAAACADAAPATAPAEAGFDTASVQSMVIKPDRLKRLQPGGSDAGSMTFELVDDPDAGEVIRIEAAEGNQAWDQGLTAPSQATVKKGDVMLASFKMRNVNSMTGQALVNFIFQGGPPEYEKSAMVRVGVGTEWTQVNLPFIAKGDYKRGNAAAGFHLSLADQILEITDLQVANYGPDYDLTALPNSDVAYAGREKDAPWRAEAEDRIEKLRKGDLAVTVVDAAGQPVAGAKVSVAMTRHAFPFGTAVAVSKIRLDSKDGERYRNEITNNFNFAVFESAMKWNNYGTGTPAQIREALDWLVEQEIVVRGHVLMWPGWRWVEPDLLPQWAKDGTQPSEKEKAAFRKVMEERVTDMTALYQEEIKDWDVVNEAYTINEILKVYGEEIMIDWFKLAHEANPDAVLYINDNDMITNQGRETKHLQAYQKQIQDLLDAGAPVGGIGMQGHFSTALTAPEDVWKTLDRFKHFDLPIQITEFDVMNEDPTLQADYQRDFLTAAFAHESIAGFTMWGFWEGQHWRPSAAIYDKDWNLRPHGKAYRDLVYGTWWTREQGKTGSDGTLTLRGFFGDYDVTVTGPDGAEEKATATLSKDGAAVEVRLGG